MIDAMSVDDEDFFEKIEICLCKEDVYHLDVSIYKYAGLKSTNWDSLYKVDYKNFEEYLEKSLEKNSK